MFGSKKITPLRTVNLVKDPEGRSAVNLTKLTQQGNTHIDLAKRSDKARISLEKRNLAGIRAEVVMLLDHSGSMYADYQSGAVQQLVERALAFSLQVDVNGAIPVIPFDSRVLPDVEVTVDNYKGVVERDIWRGRDMGSTDLASALEVVRDMADEATSPLFVVVVTDGNPDSQSATTSIACELARYPVFLKFLALRSVPYLAELDKLSGSKRLLDNVNAKPSKGGPSLLTCTDEQFAEAMADEWDTWLVAAKAAGVLA
jgi:hypothetical protein